MKIYQSILALLLPLTVGGAMADAPLLDGKQIALEADRRASGFVDSEEHFTMVLRDAKGRERIREMRIRTLERTDDGDWSLNIFDKPADVKGTAFLTHSHGLAPDDQWIFLPALKRVKRISSKNKSGAFMGSEFAFEDFSSFEVEKYTYQYLREEPCPNDTALTCLVSQWVPAYEHSGYGKLVIWHDVEEYRPQMTEFYNHDDKKLKTLLALDYLLKDDKFWRAQLLQMTNHRTGKVTLLKYKQVEFGLGFDERDFTQSALQRVR